jgi:predicted nucleic acid-binding protein
MRIVFADTSFYVAALSMRDVNHARSEAVGRGFRGRVVSTEYVLLEVATFFCEAPHRAVFLGLLHTLQNDPEITIVPSSADLWQRGVALFAARPDKDWSLTDCISFVVMQERGITDALTADHHFVQAWFVALLK